MLEIDGHKRYLPPPPGREATLPHRPGGSEYSSRYRGHSDDMHEWSIYRQNINADFVDNALSNTQSKRYPYGEFRLDPTTVSTLINNQKIDSKLARTVDNTVDANMLINFGLPRPGVGRGHFHSTEIIHSGEAGEESNLRRARSHPDNVIVYDDMRPHSHMNSSQYEARRAYTPESRRPRSHSVDDMLLEKEYRYYSDNRGTASAYGGFNRDRSPSPGAGLHSQRRAQSAYGGLDDNRKHESHYDYRQEGRYQQKGGSTRHDSSPDYRSTANLVSNAEQINYSYDRRNKDNSDKDHTNGGRFEYWTLSKGPTTPVPIGRMYAKNDWYWDKYPPPTFGSFDIGDVVEPQVSQYPHLQLRKVTSARHTTTCCCCCKKKRIDQALDGITLELHGGELLAILGSPRKFSRSIKLTSLSSHLVVWLFN